MQIEKNQPAALKPLSPWSTVTAAAADPNRGQPSKASQPQLQPQPLREGAGSSRAGLVAGALHRQGSGSSVFEPGPQNVGLEEVQNLDPGTKFFRLDDSKLEVAAFYQIVAARRAEGVNTKVRFTDKVGLSMQGTQIVDEHGKTLDPFHLLRVASIRELSKDRSPCMSF